MSQHHKTKEIGGRNWTVQQFGAKEGMRNLVTLMKYIGPSAAAAFNGLKGGKGFLDAEVDGAQISNAIMELVNRADEDGVLDLIDRLLSQTFTDNLPVNQQFNTLFMADYMTMFKVLAFVIEVNYGSFLPANGLKGMEAGAGQEATVQESNAS